MCTSSRWIQFTSVGLITLAASTISPVAAADAAADTAAAQVLFDRGRQLMAESNYAAACPKFEESARIVGHSGTLLNLADCYEKQGRVSSAWTTFLSAAAAAKRTDNTDRETEARNRADALVSLLPKLSINVRTTDANAGITITRDDAIIGQAQFGVPIPADPGFHKVVASMPAHRTWETTVELKANGETVQIDVPTLELLQQKNLNPSSPHVVETHEATGKNSNSQRTWALAAGGVGIAGVAFGTVAGLVSLSKKGKADEHCSGSLCSDSAGVTLRSDARTWGNISTVAFAVGAAGLVTGTALWLSSPRNESRTSAWVTVGPGTIGLNGAW